MTLSPILTWKEYNRDGKAGGEEFYVKSKSTGALSFTDTCRDTSTYTARHSGRPNWNRSHRVLPVHYAQHLLANVLSPAQRTGLDEVLVAPRVGELVVLPGVVYGQQGEVVPFGLVEFGLLLICKGLFILQAVGSSFPTQYLLTEHPALLGRPPWPNQVCTLSTWVATG